ncbi:hypothetical protein ACFV2H_19815 [Streptomyces sp. NPDC059629]|uniref:hypothetical protein n=1 Tax=Streptomyces sp. NPDC059629 TaxID=3346889 RepID=UPI0036B84523
MSEQRMKPPARRTGRPLGGATSKAAASTAAPPPAAELTHEQYTAEQAAPQPIEGALGASPGPASAPVKPTASAQASAEPGASPAAGDSVAAVVPRSAAADAERVESPLPQTVDSTVAVPEPGPAAEPSPLSGHPAAQEIVTATTHVRAPASEVAVRSTAPVASAAFPVQAKEPPHGHSHETRAQEMPSEGVPWTQGPGRPEGIPDVGIVLNQRIITRESLDSSVPTALKLKKRIKRFALDNELDHLPLGDIVAVAMDGWLSTRGF